MNNERIDVLAVLVDDSHAAMIWRASEDLTRPIDVWRARSDEALAAVAELSRRACDALELLEGIAPDHPRTAKLRAALARVGGAI